MAEITLTFINQSNDTNNSQVVIFQQNTVGDLGGAAVAWRVISNPQAGHRETFRFPYTVLGADLLPGAQPGQVIRTANLSDTAASFALDGITSADLVLSGGQGEPHRFTLQNVR